MARLHVESAIQTERISRTSHISLTLTIRKKIGGGGRLFSVSVFVRGNKHRKYNMQPDMDNKAAK